ncbi:hypothetical protein [Campylobacter sp. US33a]|uniref:hypothetical protein n=1 Tax=Campylobacter sp. US33a TaxID=2498120 RepID=UPI0010677081|nr:hypothetical protein [Campylobacter sp. US33a]TEY02715.1 hypothetical protein ELQ16_04885 [Campylobacter sp. US33a]
MLEIRKLDSNSVFSNTKIKEKNISKDEFQASLNEIKKEQEKDNKSFLTNEDLDLSKIKSDFSAYAFQKLQADQQKENEKTIIDKLFSIIDKNNGIK